jgi:hypothetical protein
VRLVLTAAPLALVGTLTADEATALVSFLEALTDTEFVGSLALPTTACGRRL